MYCENSVVRELPTSPASLFREKTVRRRRQWRGFESGLAKLLPLLLFNRAGAESRRSRTMLQRLRRVDDLLKCLCVSVGCSPTALLVQAFEMTLDRSSDNTWSSTRASPETPPPLSSLILLSHSGGPLSRAREGPRRRHRHRQCRR